MDTQATNNVANVIIPNEIIITNIIVLMSSFNFLFIVLFITN